MKKAIILVLSVVAATFATSSGSGQVRSFVLVAPGNQLPKNLQSAVADAGGRVTQQVPAVGIAIAESSDARFAAQAKKLGVSILPNVRWKSAMPLSIDGISVPDQDARVESHTLVPTDSFYPAQWSLTAINALGAWAAGQKGAGVRVAVLDSGIAATHIDIAPNLNTALSTSFVPGEAYDAVGTAFNHGTHVAGIIAASANHVGTVGVAPLAEIVAVKVLSSATGSGSFGGILSGIVYAASIHADVINMSLGAEFPRHGFTDDNGTPSDPSDDVWVGANEVSALVTALGRATTYAYQQGTTVIAAAGNSGIDRDHDADLWAVPADCPHVIAVSATSPFGWVDFPANSLDILASYSNFGQSRIDFAAPGGDFDYPPVTPRTVGPLTAPAWVFDMVLAPSNRVGASNRYSWAAGTSMAAPHVSGVAAIIIGKNGGSMKPSAVEAALRASADDLGKPGNDDAYGAGRVNAGRAAQ